MGSVTSLVTSPFHARALTRFACARLDSLQILRATSTTAIVSLSSLSSPSLLLLPSSLTTRMCPRRSPSELLPASVSSLVAIALPSPLPPCS